MPIITITGPESTGKTTMAHRLATYLKGTLVEEVVRKNYSPRHTFSAADVHTIAMQQSEAISTATGRWIIADTDALTTLIWLEDKWASINPAMEALWLRHLPDKYLLMYPDIPWHPDPMRSDKGRRMHLYNQHIRWLQQVDTPISIIKGLGDQRWENVKSAIAPLL